MGLDGVELVMAFEEHFGIEIPDADAATLVTPGLVIDFICSRLTLTEGNVCQSQRAFYRLRRATITVLGKKRRELSPHTPLRDLSPDKDCTAWWSRIKDEVQAHDWPTPARPYWMERAIFFLTLTALFGIPIFLHMNGNPFGTTFGVISGIITAIVLPISLVVLTKPWRTRIPRDLKTMRDLISYVATSDAIQWDRELVARVVKDIVIRQLALDESKYSEDAHFVEDLGIG